MERIIIPLFMVPGIFGCAIDTPDVYVERTDFIFIADGTQGTAESKSLLPEGEDFENSIHNVVLMLYDSSTGILETIGKTEGSTCSIALTGGRDYTLYAFANMEDMESQAPVYEKDIPGTKYMIPDFESMEITGLPMAGTITFTAGTASVAVNLRRLVAKVIITADYSEMGSAGDPKSFSGGTFKVHRAARTLYPFAEGGSRAIGDHDLFPEEADMQAVSDPMSPVSGELILYIPENMQGNLFGERVPTDEFDNSLFTYISFDGSKTGAVDGVSGEFTYRFFPYGNDSESLDLEGGKIYYTHLILTWNGMYTTGNWEVTRSSWNDGRRIRLSAQPDGQYSGFLSLRLPPGVIDYPYYVFYTVNNLNYSPYPENGISRHKNYGWTFTSENRVAPDCNSVLSLDNGISFGFISDESVRSRHGITIPPDKSLINSNATIIYHTTDKRYISPVSVKIVEPSIIIDRYEVVCAFNECSPDDSFSIRVTGGTVPLQYISVSCDNPLLHVGSYSPATGSIECCWSGQNDGNSYRLANLTFSGLDASATCRIHQKSHETISVEEDVNGGSGNIEY